MPKRTHLTSYLFNRMLITNRSLCNVSVTLSFGFNFTYFLIHGSCSTNCNHLVPLQSHEWPPTVSFLLESSGIITSGSGFLSFLSFLANFWMVPSLINLSISSFNYLHSSVVCPWFSWKHQYFVLSCLLALSKLCLVGHLTSLLFFLIYMSMCIHESFKGA